MKNHEIREAILQTPAVPPQWHKMSLGLTYPHIDPVSYVGETCIDIHSDLNQIQQELEAFSRQPTVTAADRNQLGYLSASVGLAKLRSYVSYALYEQIRQGVDESPYTEAVITSSDLIMSDIASHDELSDITKANLTDLANCLAIFYRLEADMHFSYSTD